MNWTDKEIDNLFKENAEASSVGYKDAYWKEMEALLPVKSGGDTAWMFTAFLFIGILVVSSFMNSSSSIENQQRLLAKSNNFLLNENLNHRKSSIRDKNTIIETKLEENEFSSQKKRIDENLALKSTTSGKMKIKSELKSSKRNSETSISILTSPTATKLNFPIINQGVSSIKLVSTKGITSSQPSQIVTEEQRGEIVVYDNSPMLIESKVHQLNVSSNSDESIENRIIDQTKGQVNQSINYKVGMLEMKRATIFLSSDLKELANNIVSDLTVPARIQTYLQVLGGLSQSLITPSSKLSYSWGVGAGTTFGKGRFVFTTGLNGIWSSHDDLILSREAKVYGFGSDIIRYDLQYKDIFSIEADLSVGYRFGNGTLKIGLRPSYVVGTKVSYERMEKGLTIKDNFYGYADGLNRVGLKPTIGYSYDLNSGYSIGLNVGTQLMPLVRHDFINGENNTLPFDAQIYFRKTLKFKK